MWSWGWLTFGTRSSIQLGVTEYTTLSFVFSHELFPWNPALLPTPRKGDCLQRWRHKTILFNMHFGVCCILMISIVSLSTLFDYFQYSRVKPIVTPRFSLSCSETLMGELGNIAKIHDLHIQVGIFFLFVHLSRPARLLIPQILTVIYPDVLKILHHGTGRVITDVT